MLILSCFYEPWWAYLLRGLLEGAAQLMILATPVAICVVLWDVFANKGSTPGSISFLGLDESAQTYSPTVESHFPIWTVLLYLLSGFTTFGLGVLVFDAVQLLS